MTQAQRVALFGVIGAVAGLLFHPAARPFAIGAFAARGASDFLEASDDLPSNLDVLPPPESEVEAALWMLVGSERSLTRLEAERLVEVSERFAERDADNAFWRQMQAVFLLDLGDVEGATRAWRLGSRAVRWNDLQTERLERVVSGLAQESGRPMSWHYALAYRQRSSAPARAAFAAGETLLAEAAQAGGADAGLRYDTLLNGELLRDGGRSAVAAQHGRRLVDLAAFDPPILNWPPKPSELEIARGETIRAWYGTLGEGVALTADEAFRASDAWSAFVDPEAAEAEARALGFWSSVTATLPSALFAIAVLGAALWGLGALAESKPLFEAPLKPPLAPLIGLGLGGALYAGTGLAWPAIWVALAWSSLTFGWSRSRSDTRRPLTFAHRTTVSTLAALAMGFFALVWLTTSTPGTHLATDTDSLFLLRSGSGAVWSLFATAACLALATGPAWATIERRNPTPVVAKTLGRLGATWALLGVSLGLITTPFAVVIDLQLTETLSKRFANESTYHLIEAEP